MPTGHTGTIIDITVTGIIDIGGELSRQKKGPHVSFGGL